MKRSTKPFDSNENRLIISSLKNGCIETFENVYRLYFRGLCAFCSRYVSIEESEEIVQDTMVWLYENRQSLIPELSLKTLLFTIVKNKALNKIAHHEVQRKVFSEIAEKFEAEFSDPDFYLRNELFSLYDKALEKLPREFREAYDMNRSEHMTHKEIAALLNVSQQTVNYRISQALKILRVELKDYLPLILVFFSFFSFNADNNNLTTSHQKDTQNSYPVATAPMERQHSKTH